MRLVSLWLAVVSLAVAGCAALPPSKALATADREVSAGRDVVVGVAQAEANVAIEASNVAAAGGGGLLLALVDAGINQSRTQTAEQRVAPIRAALTGYSFDAKARDALQAAVTQLPWMAVKTVSFTKEATNGNYARLLEASPASQVAFANFDYVFTGDFKTLRVGLQLSMFAKPAGKADPAMPLSNALYYNGWVYTSNLNAPTEDPVANAAAWAANGGEAARAQLEAGIAAVIELMIKDLQTPAPAAVAAAP